MKLKPVEQEAMVFFLTETAEVWSYALPVVHSIPAGMEGQFVTAGYGQTLQQLQQRFPDMVLLTESEAIALQSEKKHQ
ncbi:hypothetical protein EL06_25815 [Salmonella enterica subsp. diarizonae]|uniref:Uncharacterized protein n=1 Tax=Salmonella diarizonae TaxID=59204 RepID=A0A6C8Y5I7_SALDZ|nr:hypothetical protein [Salmonella enterica subsp. diarizonae]ECK6787737.1 hypothetical protein [Salmonella enterica]MIE72709.1 hypothetical protein [Salmonella enterica subsp. diarizonae]